MKIAIIFATNGPNEDSVVAPFRSSGFIGHLCASGIDPVVITVIADRRTGNGSPGNGGGDILHCRRPGLAAVIAAERPNAVQTFGPEFRLADIWPLAARHAPVSHCVSSWRNSAGGANRGFSPAIAGLRKSSRHVQGLIGTSRSGIGDLIAAGWFSGAVFSVVVPPPAKGAMGPIHASSMRHAGNPVFGIYDPAASSGDIAFILRAIALTGRAATMQMRIATKHPAAAAPGVTTAFVAVTPIEAFLATIDVLVVPVYDDSVAPAIMAALHAGKSVIVPDASGAAELVGYGRHGTTFPQGSAYHLANAMNVIHQAWSQTPPLATDPTSVLARTSPAVVAQAFAMACRRLVSGWGETLGRAPVMARG